MALRPKKYTATSIEGARAMITSSMIFLVLSLPCTWGAGETISFLIYLKYLIGYFLGRLRMIRITSALPVRM